MKLGQGTFMPTSLSIPPERTSTPTFVYRTGKDRMGILQLLESASDSPGIQLRFKQVVRTPVN